LREGEWIVSPGMVEVENYWLSTLCTSLPYSIKFDVKKERK